jgi:hypothetical protein
MDIHETLYEYHATRGHPNFLLSNFLLSATRICWVCELLRREPQYRFLLNEGLELLCDNRYSIFPFLTAKQVSGKCIRKLTDGNYTQK